MDKIYVAHNGYNHTIIEGDSVVHAISLVVKPVRHAGLIYSALLFDARFKCARLDVECTRVETKIGSLFDSQSELFFT